MDLEIDALARKLHALQAQVEGGRNAFRADAFGGPRQQDDEKRKTKMSLHRLPLTKQEPLQTAGVSQ